MKFTLFIPFRNEIEGLKAIMPLIKREWVDEILLLDGSSTDGSKEWLESQGYKVHSQKSKGVKGAFWEAFEIAQGDVIIPFSPDGNSIPDDVPKLVAKINEGYDMVIASRYLGKIKSDDDDFMSQLANRVLTGMINLFCGTNYTDGIGMYKAFKKKHLYELGIDKHKHEHSEILLTCRAPRHGLKVTEISSPEPKRIGPPGSRAHPGALGKYKSGLLLMKQIVRDGLFYRPKR
jgi:glycosyltransferase involved in cell wall biosynthesis